MRFSKALMQLFWTAGPVTAIGLILGYYIGYGKLPPSELMIYFISFTVFSGLTGLIAKFVYDSTRGHVQQQREQDLKFVNGSLGSFILDIRNLQIEAYEGADRKREAALQLVRRVELEPYGVYQAFTDLTDNRKTGLIMSRLHTYRKAGLFSHVKDLQNHHEPYLRGEINRLKATSPDAAALLERSFYQLKGYSLRQGVAREAYFMQRIFAAMEKADPLLITLKDAEEFIILCIELINGRELPALTFSYRGNWEIAEAFDTLERRRLAFRVTQAKGSNRLFALAAYLRESAFCDETNLPKGLAPQQLSHHIWHELNRLAEILLSNPEANLTYAEISRLQQVLKNGFMLYELALRGYSEVTEAHEKYAAAISKWQKVNSGKPVRFQFIINRWNRKGININEGVIALSSDHKDELIRQLSWYFRQDGIASLLKAEKGEAKLLDTQTPGSDYNDRCEAVRRLVIETAVVLDPMIELSRPEVRRNINATKGIYLGELSPDLTAAQKQVLFEQLVAETDNDLSEAAEQMAQTMTNVYQIPLDTDARRFLNLTYGTDAARLESIVRDASHQELNLAAWAGQDKSDAVIPKLYPIPRTWKKALRYELKNRH